VWLTLRFAYRWGAKDSKAMSEPRPVRWILDLGTDTWKNQAQEIAQSNADHAKWRREMEATLVREQERSKALADALDELMAFQNGCPLPSYRKASRCLGG